MWKPKSLLHNYINQKYQAPESQEFIKNYNPATGEVLNSIPNSSKDDVDAAVTSAENAFGYWSHLSQEERIHFLDKIADGIQERFDEFVMAECLDTGKPISLCKMVDIPRAIKNFKFFSNFLKGHKQETFEMDGATNYIHRSPLGVVALITPWNLPLYLLTWKIAPALAMGNTIVAKPSEMTPLTADLLTEVMTEVGLPKGVFNLIHGKGNPGGQSLIEHPKVKAISFTGGTKTGQGISKSVAGQMKKLSLELGGKNPSIVFADCDFEKTVKGVAKAAILNQGQICLCGSRILIEKPIYEDFKNALVEELKTWKIGPPDDPETTMGSLISMDHLNKVQSYVELSKTEGGYVLIGGAPLPDLPNAFKNGAFFQPTLIEGCDYRSRTACEEIFGPVATLHAFENENEALTMANHVEYGLSASVWTKDLKRAHQFSTKLDSGLVWVNTWLKRDLRTPFGGVKNSGMGREGGIYSINFFSELQNICIESGDS